MKLMVVSQIGMPSPRSTASANISPCSHKLKISVYPGILGFYFIHLTVVYCCLQALIY